MQFWRKSLIRRLTFYFLLFSLVPVSVVGSLAFWRARVALQQSVFDQLNLVVSSREEDLTQWITDQVGDVFVLARSAQVQNVLEVFENQEAFSVENQQEALFVVANHLSSILEADADYAEILVLTLDGQIIYSTNEATMTAVAESPQFFEDNQLFATLSPVHVPDTLNQPAMTVTTPVLNNSSSRIGYLAVHLDLGQFNEILLGQSGLAQGGQIFLVNDTFQLVTAVDQINTQSSDPIHTVAIDTAVAGENGSQRYLNHNGMPVLGAYRWLVSLDMAIVAEIPEEIAFAPAQELGSTIVIVGLVLAVALAVSVRVLTRQIAEPILNVSYAAVQVTDGDFGATATVYTEDEIGTLARHFNQMTERLRRILQSLEAQVTARTAELALTVEQLNLINQVGRTANSIIEVDPLLASVATLIRQTFNYYVVMVVRFDAEANEIYLAAADSAENIDLLSYNLRVSMDRTSIIGHVVRTEQALVVDDVSQEPRYMAIEQLPKTRSELALPLLIGGQVLGVLDLQSEQVNAFSPDDVRVLQTLADQIAVATQNAELFQTAEIARADAEEANRLKTQFLTNMSHELRTPLNAVINFAYLLTMGVGGQITTEQKDMLNRISLAGEHLLNLINDILDLAKIESGRVAMFIEDSPVEELVLGVMSTAVGLISGKNIKLRHKIPEDLPLVRADRGRIRQVLLNLVSNAAKFTKEGTITVRAEATNHHVTISVTDTGIGIAPEDIPKAFTAFVQIDGEMTRKEGGTGLGLPISKQFVEMHGGQMWVESEVDQGTTFYFTLPIVDNDQPQEVTSPSMKEVEQK
jgi:signal transduction histidine kinase/HAMP domain-containing protein